jgi:thiamine-monophosphate kinase
MIDVSDGLALDLTRMAGASGTAVELERVPVADGATRQQALGGGEDYELVFTAPADVDVAAAFAGAGLAVPIEIGRCREGPPGTVLLDGRRLDAAGYQHWA